MTRCVSHSTLICFLNSPPPRPVRPLSLFHLSSAHLSLTRSLSHSFSLSLTLVLSLTLSHSPSCCSSCSHPCVLLTLTLSSSLSLVPSDCPLFVIPLAHSFSLPPCSFSLSLILSHTHSLLLLRLHRHHRWPRLSHSRCISHSFSLSLVLPVTRSPCHSFSLSLVLPLSHSLYLSLALLVTCSLAHTLVASPPPSLSLSTVLSHTRCFSLSHTFATFVSLCLAVPLTLVFLSSPSHSSFLSSHSH